MNKRQRMPGILQGQIYTYPRQRWRKRRRQYLIMNSRAFARAADSILEGEGDVHNISQSENPALQDTDSKDSQLLKDEVSKVRNYVWFNNTVFFKNSEKTCNFRLSSSSLCRSLV